MSASVQDAHGWPPKMPSPGWLLCLLLPLRAHKRRKLLDEVKWRSMGMMMVMMIIIIIIMTVLLVMMVAMMMMMMMMM